MKTIDKWLTEYGKDHQNPTNQFIHKICVPLIMFSVLGLVWLIPTPHIFYKINPSFNWAFVFSLIGLSYYLILDRFFFFIMLIVSILMLYMIHLIDQTQLLFHISSVLFILAWIGQFLGHKIEGQKPSFLEDIRFFLIGPLWVIKDIKKIYKK